MKKNLLLVICFAMILFGLTDCNSGHTNGQSTNELDSLLIASKQGDLQAQFWLGEHYMTGNGVEIDYDQAVYWWSKAAKHGNAQAQHGLGFCYYYGNGVECDYSQAVYWYRKAAEQGIELAALNKDIELKEKIKDIKDFNTG